MIPPPPHTHTERGFSTLARVGKKKIPTERGFRVEKRKSAFNAREET